MLTVERTHQSFDQIRSDDTALPTLRGQRILSLDGIRALAVALVIAYHFKVPGLEHGYIGVDVFFTLSGFLITGLFVEEHDFAGRIRVRRFMWRRARRLWPEALLVVVFAVVCNWLLLNGSDGPVVKWAAATLLEVANWFGLITTAKPSHLIGHLWSLSVEEQFYLVWPFVIMFAVGKKGLFKGRRPLRAVAWVSVCIFGASFLEGLVFRIHKVPNDRLYFGSDIRAAQLLIGAILFCILKRFPLQARRLTPSALGWLALAALTALGSHYPQAGKAGLDSVGALLPQIITCVLLMTCLLTPESSVSRLLSLRPLVWIGQLSYGLYIWHYPIAYLCEQRLPGPRWFELSVALVASVAASYFSAKMVKALLARFGSPTKPALA